MATPVIPEQISNCISAVSGSTAGGLSMLATYPLDQVKTILQVDANSLLPLPRPLRPLGSTMGGLIYLASSNPKRLFVGASASTETVMLSNFIYYYLLKGTETKIATLMEGRGYSNNSITSALIASTVAGSLNVILTEPLWRASTVVKLRSEGKTQSVLVETMHIVRKEGLSRSVRGLGASLLLVSNPVVQYVAQVLLRTTLVKGRRKDILTAKEAFLVGALAKAVATVVTYPLQVIQSRLRASQGNSEKHDGLMSCTQDVIRENGITGLYSGVGAKLTQTVTNAALM
ncbi:conserved hypothetical protein [Perkinsus marinus ATCC 50983]|uniref:Peroxisomal membrane protein pmp34 n=1 Tax=Perkinsus marinus (strain ATCC 50983 / TXsc) TaxID=423536 RepID=C5KFH5_PERM5|nr:conserved hypothetical protein [Perkinsus marinus ATCC 50983]EER16724.1 conserved hypothetical protein [Perkinsus marinus ATCC 50983]|eukprot:XP_002784928.1 conserved hypothetical protein [Perkinsus marinus ATCC 50983]